VHIGGLAAVGVFTFGGSWILYRLTDAILPMRVSAHQEAIGLDLSQHGESI
jgi:Amt family ammonium transporter